MEIRYLDDIKDIGQTFVSRFVMSWEEFQIKMKDRIAERAKSNYPLDLAWYEQAYFWDRMDPAFPAVSMDAALAFLREHSGPVFFMTEKGEREYFQGKKSIDFIAEADAQALAEKIEQEWYDDYRLEEQGMYDPDAILPDDLYVFDASMTWCAVFTHETTDWESEIENPIKAAQSRYCLICNPGR